MIDAPDVLRDYLLSKPTLTALIGTRLWAERIYPPTGYTPSQGGAIAFRSRGGAPDYSSALLGQSWQFKCYGANELAANAVYRALFDVLHDAKGGSIHSAHLDIAGQTLEEPTTGWPYVLCFYETIMLAQAA
jgi:hypothetical protein